MPRHRSVACKRGGSSRRGRGREQAAAAAQKRGDDALKNALQAVENRTITAGSLQSLRAILAELRNNRLDGQLAATIADATEGRGQWEPFRKEFKVSGISAEGDKLGASWGLGDGTLAAETLIQEARLNGNAARIVKGGGAAYVAAATRVPVPGHRGSAVLVLAKPLDEGALKVFRRARGRRNPPLRRQPSRSPAKASPTSSAHLGPGRGARGRGAGVSQRRRPLGRGLKEVAPGTWLWLYASAEKTAAAAESTATITKVIIWSAGALIAILAAFIGFRRGGAVGVAPAADPATSPGAQRVTPAVAARLSGRGVATTGPAFPAPDLSPGPTPEPLIAPPYEATQMAGASNRQFGRYTLINLLGEGGMAQVFTAVIFGAEGFRRKFVIKRLRPELVRDAGRRRPVHRRGATWPRAWSTRTSSRCSTSARSATSTSSPPSTSWGATWPGHAAIQEEGGRGMPGEGAAVRRARDAEGARVRAHQGGRRRPTAGIVHRDVSPTTCSYRRGAR